MPFNHLPPPPRLFELNDNLTINHEKTVLGVRFNELSLNPFFAISRDIEHLNPLSWKNETSCLIQHPIKASKQFAFFASPQGLALASKLKNVNNSFTLKPVISPEFFFCVNDRERTPLLLFFKFTQIYVKNRPLLRVNARFSSRLSQLPAKRRFYRLKAELFPYACHFSEKTLPFALIKHFPFSTPFAAFCSNNLLFAVYNKYNHNPLVKLNDEGEVVEILWINWSLFISEWLSFFYYLRVCFFPPTAHAFYFLAISRFFGQNREWATPRYTRNQALLRLEMRPTLVNLQTNFRALSSKNYFIFNTSLL